MSSSVAIGLRWLRRRPWSSATSIVCLAVGISASATAVTVVDASALRPFGLRETSRLAVIWEADPNRTAQMIEVSLLDFHDWQRQSASFESLAAFGSSHWPGVARIGGDVFVAAPRAVSREFFRTLGVAPTIGRDFTDEDLGAAGVSPAVLSHAFWVSRFGADSGVLGRSFFVDGEEHRVIGVMPRGFSFPDAPDMWVSVERILGRLTPEQQRAVGVLQVLGRLKQSIPPKQARGELTGIIRALHRDYFKSTVDTNAVLTPFSDVLLGGAALRLWIALLMAAAVLLFACANVTAVRIAHVRERTTELATRAYLGASKFAIATHLIAESSLLVVAAAILALLLTRGSLAAVMNVPLIVDSGIDLARHSLTSVLAVAAGTAIVWLLVAVTPSVLQAVRLRSSQLAAQSRGTVRGVRPNHVLLLSQAAVSVCLVAVAGVALQAFDRLTRLDFGFDTKRVVSLDVSLPSWKYESPDDAARLGERLVDRLKQMAGVVAVGGVSVRPFRFGEIADGLPVRRAGDATTTQEMATGASRVIVTDGYFAALGVRIVEGRAFQPVDRATARAIVSESLARTLWGTAPVTGGRIQAYTLSRGWHSYEIVGVAEDVRSRAVDRPALELYVPHGGGGLGLSSFIVRADADAPIGEAQFRAALASVEPDAALERVQTTGNIISTVLAPARVVALTTTVLAIAILVLLMLGIFGAAATVLRGAWGELAIRQAIGARPVQAALAPLRSTVMAIVAGSALGIAVTPATLDLLETVGLPQDVNRAIPLAAAAAAIAASLVLAVWPSLRKAARTSPAELLRSE